MWLARLQQACTQTSAPVDCAQPSSTPSRFDIRALTIFQCHARLAQQRDLLEDRNARQQSVSECEATERHSASATKSML